MAVILSMQRQGIGRQRLDEAAKQARLWPADGIRLDAFDADAGAGSFYAKCGFQEVRPGDLPLSATDLLGADPVAR